MARSARRPHNRNIMHEGPRAALEAETGGQRPSVERRGAVRFPIDQPVRYKVLSRGAAERGSGRTLNISSTGVLFTTELPLRPGQRLELAVNWPAQLDHKQPLKLVASGRVTRAGNGTAAMVINRHEFRTQGARGLNSL